MTRSSTASAPHRIRPARRARLALLASAAALLAAALPGPVRAQIGSDQLGGGPHQPTISPRHGPPGTEVTFRAVDLPYSPVLLVGVGVVGGGGHQMVGQGPGSMEGDFELTVRVPDWAEPGTSHYFFVATADQRPRAMAPVFLVSDERGVVRVAGEVSAVEGRCGATLTQGGDRFGLVGETGGLRPGGSAAVEGIVVERPGCEDTLVIDVSRVLRSSR